ncbi:MAG TPA: chorismate mutase [Aggregatilineales bacterium]|nr:chorismate mutase [Aggregatilineales bacterium]
MSENGHPPIVCRGIRGATTPAENTSEAILEATRELLTQIVEANHGLKPDDVASVFFTTTPDLDAEYPALAARQLGWTDVALMCGQEMTVPGALKKCLRVLIHWNTTRRNDEIRHIYLRDAVNLRPDRSLKNYQKQDIPQREDVRQ